MSQKADEGFAGRARLPGRPRTASARPDKAFRLGRTEERQLVRDAQAGDPRALRRLLETLSGPVYRFGRGFCRDRDDAEDVVQEVLLSLTRSLPRFRGESSLATWAYAVARNACARRRRRGVHAPKQLESLDRGGPDQGPLAVPDRTQDPARSAERSELRSALERAIASLPRSQQEVLVLRDVEGLPASEVGRILGLGERAVKSRLHRGRVALREALAPFAPAAGRRRGSRPRPAGLGACPDIVRLLSRHLEGELDSSICERLSVHVAGCATCAGACRTLQAALGACSRWRTAPLPPEVRDGVRQALRRAIAERTRPA